MLRVQKVCEYVAWSSVFTATLATLAYHSDRETILAVSVLSRIAAIAAGLAWLSIRLVSRRTRQTSRDF